MKLLVFYLTILLSFNAAAQRNNIWIFGDSAGLDFNTFPPSRIESSIYSNEACASICDASGKLMFYTDGSYIWDRYHTYMPNGKELAGPDSNVTYSTAQGAIIVPVPMSRSKYYVFSLGHRYPQNFPDNFPGRKYAGKLYYSIVDMELNNGLGDVLPEEKGILLDSLLTESMTAVYGNDCNVWLLVVSYQDTSFKAYNVTRNGINRLSVKSPVLAKSLFGFVERSSGHYLTVSPDRRKLALGGHYSLSLYDFDPSSGKVDGAMVIDSFDLEDFNRPLLGSYGSCFSFDGKRLYVSTRQYGLLQFNLAIKSLDSIKNSKLIFDTTQEHWALMRGADHKIYIVSQGALSVINEPDLLFPACQYEKNYLQFLPGTGPIIGLPMQLESRLLVNLFHDTLHCKDKKELMPTKRTGIYYEWENGDTTMNRVVDSSGVYWVRYEVSDSCYFRDIYVDTFYVMFDYSIRNTKSLTRKMGRCREDIIELSPQHKNGINYFWDDGSTGINRVVSYPGIFWVNYRIDSLCENRVDSFIVHYPNENYEMSFIVDSIVCVDKSVIFKNTSDTIFDNFHWNFGDGGRSDSVNPSYIYQRQGNYDVTLVGRISAYCSDTLVRSVIVDSLSKAMFRMERDSICAGESINLYTDINSSTISYLEWMENGQLRFASSDRVVNWSFNDAGISVVKLNANYRACPDNSFTDTVYVFPLPLIDLGPDTLMCVKSDAIILYNRALYQYGQSYLWNTGSKEITLRVTHPGSYNLTVSTEQGCTTSEKVFVSKNCFIDLPNAFTPNDDGANDYFFPKPLLSSGVERLRFQIFNRWGSILFKTENKAGLGWDGRYNGMEQPQGIYLYFLEIEYDNGIQESYQGDVTLIR